MAFSEQARYGKEKQDVAPAIATSASYGQLEQQQMLEVFRADAGWTEV
jgi:hypothetical protein